MGGIPNKKKKKKKKRDEICHKENLQAAVVSDSHISGGVQHILNIPIEIVVINEITKNILCELFCKILS